MATMRRFIPDWDAEALRIERVEPEHRRAALAVLLTGRVAEADPSVDAFLSFTRAQRLNLEDLWVAWQDQRPVASALLVPAAGRTAMLFISPAAAGTTRDDDPRVPLIRAVVADRCPDQMRLIQCLLDPSQNRERRALLAGGFRELATLLYLQRPADRPHSPLAVDDLGLTVRTWSDAHRPRFAEAILASYQDTLDCPGLLGVRPIDDVIEGHRRTGQFHADTWFALHHGDEPAAVLLVNQVPQQGAHELVYLGVASAWRGRGLGRRLLEHTLGLANRAGSAKVVLAVDEQNRPAQRLYRTGGFHSTGRKAALIFTPAG